MLALRIPPGRNLLSDLDEGGELVMYLCRELSV